MNNQKTEQDYIWDTLDEIFPNTTSDIYASKSLDDELRTREYEMVLDALTYHDYNQTRAARALAIGRTNFIARCKRLGISLERPTGPIFHVTL